jgi:hypothetical protein
VIVFVRSPEQQVRSHFEHFVRDNRHQGTFEAFIADKRYANVQSRILGGLGIQGYGFVGLTENYATSIALINRLYSTDFKALDLNKNKLKKQPNYALTEQELALIHQHNKADFALYQAASERFERHKKAIEESRPFLRFGLSPLSAQQAQLRVNGWLTTHESDAPQTLSVLINGIKTASIIANEYIHVAKERNMNRKGFIGFTYHFPKDIKHHDKIDFYAEPSNELLHSMHYQLPNQD